MSVRVRRIKPEDWSALRDLRLTALRDAPEAFGRTHEETGRQPAEDWRSAARAAALGDRRAWFVAESEAAGLVGLVLGRRRPPSDCLLFSMWVAPSARHGGAGRALVQAVSDWAADWDARRVVLWVIVGNEGAIRFYERIGFRILHEGPDAEAGAAYDALAMERPISG